MIEKHRKPNRKPNVVTTGRAGVGKSTLARILAEEFGYDVYALADPIKQVAASMVDSDIAEVGSVLYSLFTEVLPVVRCKEEDVIEFLKELRDRHAEALEATKPRALYQELGQGMRNMVHEDCWIMLLASQIDYSKPFVIEDVRLPNEFGYFSRLENTITVKLIVDDETRYKRLKARDGSVDYAALNHETEKYCDLFPCRVKIYNNGDIEELRQAVRNMIEHEHIWGWHGYDQVY